MSQKVWLVPTYVQLNQYIISLEEEVNKLDPSATMFVKFEIAKLKGLRDWMSDQVKEQA